MVMSLVHDAKIIVAFRSKGLVGVAGPKALEYWNLPGEVVSEGEI